MRSPPAHIRQALLDLAGRGAALLVISQDLDELFEIAGRIAVLHDGTLSRAVPASETSREAVGLLMGGGGIESTPPSAAKEVVAHAH